LLTSPPTQNRLPFGFAQGYPACPAMAVAKYFTAVFQWNYTAGYAAVGGIGGFPSLRKYFIPAQDFFCFAGAVLILYFIAYAEYTAYHGIQTYYNSFAVLS